MTNQLTLKDLLEKYQLELREIIIRDRHGKRFFGNIQQLANDSVLLTNGREMIWINFQSIDSISSAGN